MSPYLKIAALAWQEYLVYRLNLVLEFFGRFLQSGIMVVLWWQVFASRGDDPIYGYTLSVMLTYLVVAGILENLFELSSQGDEINDDIREGRVGSWLVRPISALGVWFTRDLTRRVFTFLCGLVPWLVIIAILHEQMAPIHPRVSLVMVAVLVIAFLVDYFLFTDIALLAFWFNQTWGPRFVLRVAIPLLAGTFVPFDVFPSWFQTVVAYTPFPIMRYVPTALLLNGTLPPHADTMITAGVVWLVVLLALEIILWRRGVRRYDVSEAI